MYPYIYIVLPSYTVLALVGGFFALLCTYFRLDKCDVKFTAFIKIFIGCVFAGIIGGKVLFAITQIPQLIINFSVNNLIQLVAYSGLVFYGGLFGVLVALKIGVKIGRYDGIGCF
jgi:prolipoprotein diacylglyceryltransferase